MSELVSVNLLKCYSLPIMLYRPETVRLSNSDISKLDNCLNLIVMKIFHSSTAVNV